MSDVDVRALVERDCARQGIPARITDRAVLDRIAALATVDERRDRATRTRSTTKARAERTAA